MALLAVAGLVATVWWVWPRLSSRTWKAVLGRVGVLLANQLLILLALALVINNYGLFIGSWSDLFGTDENTGGSIITQGGEIDTTTGQGSKGVQVINTSPVGLLAKGHSGGKLQEVVVSGATSKLSSSGFVYLPPQYFEKKWQNKRFPVIVALTGYPGDARNLITRMELPTRLAQAIDNHEIRPTVMVLMRPTVAPPRDTECMDVPNGPQVETYFTKDLRESLSSAYRVGTKRENWGILGGSTGGYCALKMSMRHPEAFAAAVSLSGYYKAPIDPTTGDLFGGDHKLQDENDLMWRLAHLPHPPITVLVTSSKKGEANYKSTMAFLGAVKPPMQASSLILPSGGHNFNTWNRELPQALPWLGQQLQAPTDEAATPTSADATPAS
ncbi:alpha/beta hydrolase [Sphaerisporangium fuscum]|uniref:alpha/beta hydrolase n=1 Tax=Sphaerisporangium fuscum TaxID=2835868 RepID=UPI001BDC6205|nr:alpha/beta hydrolase-fold protein [Sphaerisporangium fuscum]